MARNRTDPACPLHRNFDTVAYGRCRASTASPLPRLRSIPPLHAVELSILDDRQKIVGRGNAGTRRRSDGFPSFGNQRDSGTHEVPEAEPQRASSAGKRRIVYGQSHRSTPKNAS
jgi:hypothetical protein